MDGRGHAHYALRHAICQFEDLDLSDIGKRAATLLRSFAVKPFALLASSFDEARTNLHLYLLFGKSMQLTHSACGICILGDPYGHERALLYEARVTLRPTIVRPHRRLRPRAPA